jgi:hypothetical protein
MMKELNSGFLLAWRCIRTDRKERPTPSVLIFPTVEYVASSTVTGEAIIRDVDGSEWKATYSSEGDLVSIIKDFNRLTGELIKSKNGEP